jgi:hypothetical protein
MNSLTYSLQNNSSDCEMSCHEVLRFFIHKFIWHTLIELFTTSRHAHSQLFIFMLLQLVKILCVTCHFKAAVEAAWSAN